MPHRIEVEGLKDLNRLARRAADSRLPARIGEVNKDIGRLVISHLQPRPVPAAVGEGSGADVRPSATKREVLLRVGGKFRTHAPMQQWGRRQVRSAAPPKRPFILGTAERHRKEIEKAYMKGLMEAMSPAFWKAK